LTESYSGGTLNGLSVNGTCNAYLQLDTMNIKNGSTVLQNANYGYDTAGRLSTVSDSPFTATYCSLGNSTLAQSVTFTNTDPASDTVTTKSYDCLRPVR